MALTAKLDTAYASLTQAQKAGTARALIQPLRSDIIRINAELQAISDSGSLASVDAEIISALVAAWDIIKAAETAFEDAAITELLDWRP